MKQMKTALEPLNCSDPINSVSLFEEQIKKMRSSNEENIILSPIANRVIDLPQWSLIAYQWICSKAAFCLQVYLRSVLLFRCCCWMDSSSSGWWLCDGYPVARVSRVLALEPLTSSPYNLPSVGQKKNEPQYQSTLTTTHRVFVRPPLSSSSDF